MYFYFYFTLYIIYSWVTNVALTHTNTHMMIHFSKSWENFRTFTYYIIVLSWFENIFMWVFLLFFHCGLCVVSVGMVNDVKHIIELLLLLLWSLNDWINSFIAISNVFWRKLLQDSIKTVSFLFNRWRNSHDELKNDVSSSRQLLTNYCSLKEPLCINRCKNT